MAEEARKPAENDCYAIDQVGVRRLIKAGDYVPSHWTLVDGDEDVRAEVNAEAVPEAKPRGRSRPRHD